MEHLKSSHQTLIDGIRHAEKLGGAPISAKFEVEDGKLWLSVYAAKRGIKPDAEHNVLIEYRADASQEIWDPMPEVLQDVARVARAATQLTLLQLGGSSLEDAIEKASAVQTGAVYSASPEVRNGAATVEAAVATPDGKSTIVHVDLCSGAAEKAGG